MVIRLVRSYRAFLALESHWDELWHRACPDNVFLHFRWMRSFVDAFDLESELYVLVWQRSEKVAAILPLLRNQDGSLSVIGSPRSDYFDLICHEDDVAEAAPGIFDFLMSRKDWRRLRIGELSERSRLYRHCHGNPDLAWSLNWQSSSKCPGIEFSEDGETLSSLVGKKSLKRRENGLARHGEVRFRRLEKWDDVSPVLNSFYEQHISRWKLAGHESQFVMESERRFCEYYVRNLLDANILHFTELACDDSVMAFHLGFETEQVYTWYKPTFNVDFKRLSPGEVLIKRLLEYCGETGIRYFDFARGVEPFKKRFSNTLYRNFDLIVFSRRRDQLAYELRSKSEQVSTALVRKATVARRRLGVALS